MGNCLKRSPSDDFTRLQTEEVHEIPAQRQRQNNQHRQRCAETPPPPYRRRERHARQGPVTTYHPTPGIRRSADQLTEDEQVKIAQRIGLIQHLPTGLYYHDESAKKGRECAICMIDFEIGDQMRFLPCLHAYHKDCIDDWLMRSFTCPSCMEPVDAALLSSFET